MTDGPWTPLKASIPLPPKPTQSEPRDWNCICGGTGVVTASLNENPLGQYAFRCACYRGRNDRRQKLPQWDPATLGTKYTLIR